MHTYLSHSDHLNPVAAAAARSSVISEYIVFLSTCPFKNLLYFHTLSFSLSYLLRIYISSKAQLTYQFDVFQQRVQPIRPVPRQLARAAGSGGRWWRRSRLPARPEVAEPGRGGRVDRCRWQPRSHGRAERAAAGCRCRGREGPPRRRWLRTPRSSGRPLAAGGRGEPGRGGLLGRWTPASVSGMH
jgi:hypothetical protein